MNRWKVTADMASTVQSQTKTHARMERLLALVNHPNTPEHERAVAQQFLDRLRAKTAARVEQYRRDHIWYGAKYDHSGELRTTDIAKLIREEIKAIRKVAAKTGTPDAEGAVALTDAIGDAPASIKFSIRSQYYSGGSSIDIRISGVPREWGWAWGPDPRGRWAQESWHHTPALRALIDELGRLMAAYNHDGSDITTDYYDVRFSSSVDTAWDEDPNNPRAK